MRWSSEDFEGAISDFDKVIRVDPRNVQAYRNRGNIRVDKGDFAEAFVDFNQVIFLNPRNAELYSDRGFPRRKSGDFDSAIADLTRAIEIRLKASRAEAPKRVSASEGYSSNPLPLSCPSGALVVESNNKATVKMKTTGRSSERASADALITLAPRRKNSWKLGVEHESAHIHDYAVDDLIVRTGHRTT